MLQPNEARAVRDTLVRLNQEQDSIYRTLAAQFDGLTLNWSGEMANACAERLKNTNKYALSITKIMDEYINSLTFAITGLENADESAAQKNTAQNETALGGAAGIGAGVGLGAAGKDEKLRPVSGRISQEPAAISGVNIGDGVHRGIDYGIPDGTPVKSPVKGKIVELFGALPPDYVNHSKNLYGNYIVIEDENGVRYWLAHLSKTEKLNIGDTVQAGALIGHSGHTGNTYGSHLHFEMRLPPYSWRNNQAPPEMYNPFR
jgi:murein DD-endopeptidase MepM/ murein hydrolase activator NlpD